MATKKKDAGEEKKADKKRPEPAKVDASAELHHAPVQPATPEHPFDDALLDVAFDAAFDRLAKVPAARHEALIQAWVARRNAGAVDAIAKRDDAPSAARKAAKRALSVLKSRGITPPERPSVVAAMPKPAISLEARVLFPDGRGTQIWWIAKISKSGSTDAIEITTADRQGIVSVNRGNPTAGNLRQLWQSWVTRAGRAPSEVPVEWARRRLAEAKAVSVAAKQVLPMGLDAAKDLVGDLKVEGAAPKHPILAEDLAIPSAEEAVKARLDGSMHLHEEPEFGSWLPEDPAAVMLLQTINERVLALGEKPEQAKIDTTVHEAIDEAANAYFDEERKRLYVSRMHDAAWSLYRAGLVDRAIDALMVAAAIEKAGIVSDRPSEIAFVRGMFLKLIAVAQQRAQAMSPRGDEEAARLANP